MVSVKPSFSGALEMPDDDRAIHTRAWEFVKAFKPQTAALLIIGIDPAAAIEVDTRRSANVLKQMRVSYSHACASAEASSAFGSPLPFAQPAGSLASIQFRVMLERATKWNDARDFINWIRGSNGLFEEQSFSRSDIDQWLIAKGFQSAYAFVAPPAKSAQANAPLSSKERTTLLNTIGGLLALMLETGPLGKTRSGYDDQAAIIDGLLARYAGAAGLSKRNLEAKFAEAKRTLSGRAE
ncbi:hypothetical protein [Variovorax sp. IB41]|uniref:hypothetical protein n=1 Tax=Variovorax sp. IB41 TaxID=2779370 RepID=UPI0018E7F9E5|nr:hypothetical protein [Variovorax sp. IB41]MBJ2155297.1 hypothetical protein [Variovorax sp. IB41]